MFGGTDNKKTNKAAILANITLVMFALILPPFTAAAKDAGDFPKIANYYLQPNIDQADIADLAKYDLLVLDVDVQNIDPKTISTIKSLNPQVKTFAYIPSQSVNVADLSSWATFRNSAFTYVENHNGWLRDTSNNNINFSNTWPTIRFVDMGNGWTDFISDKAKNDVMSTGAWNGIFYDMVFANLSWLNNGNIDLNKDGSNDQIKTVNQHWQNKSNELIAKTKNKTNAPVIANVDIPEIYEQKLDGIMMENFPAKWMGQNNWSRLEKTYQARADKKFDIINTNTNNQDNEQDYQKMRFGLTSTLMGNGYYSFDSGDENHAQTWWFDEYDAKLGESKNKAINLTMPNSVNTQAGLWRRDFAGGAAFVNSTNQTKSYSFPDEEFTKIKGSQDTKTNDGSRVNYVRLKPNDGIILLKKTVSLENAIFNNGAFARVFNEKGEKVTNGFFTYKNGFKGDVSILSVNIDTDAQLETLVDGDGSVNIFDNGKHITSFRPYGKSYTKHISFAVADINGDGKQEIITAPGQGGGPQIKMFSITGKELSGGFFAYDKNFHGGVSLAVADISGDNVPEIITGAGVGAGPQVKIFSPQGKLLTPPNFVYDKTYRSGINVATGDTNGDGKIEIIVSPILGGGPQVKVFNKDFKLLNQFFAFDKNQRSRLNLSTSDTDKNNTDEILVGTVNFIQ